MIGTIIFTTNATKNIDSFFTDSEPMSVLDMDMIMSDKTPEELLFSGELKVLDIVIDNDGKAYTITEAGLVTVMDSKVYAEVCERLKEYKEEKEMEEAWNVIDETWDAIEEEMEVNKMKEKKTRKVLNNAKETAYKAVNKAGYETGYAKTLVKVGLFMAKKTINNKRVVKEFKNGYAMGVQDCESKHGF